MEYASGQASLLEGLPDDILYSGLERNEIILRTADDADRHWSVLSGRGPIPRR